MPSLSSSRICWLKKKRIEFNENERILLESQSNKWFIVKKLLQQCSFRNLSPIIFIGIFIFVFVQAALQSAHVTWSSVAPLISIFEHGGYYYVLITVVCLVLLWVPLSMASILRSGLVITNQRTIQFSGFLGGNMTIIPNNNIKNVSIQRGLLSNVLGIASVYFYYKGQVVADSCSTESNPLNRMLSRHQNKAYSVVEGLDAAMADKAANLMSQPIND